MSACSTEYLKRSEAITYLIEHITTANETELSNILNDIFGGERPRSDKLGSCHDFQVNDYKADRNLHKEASDNEEYW
jgi:hypothetical protein